MTDGEYKTRSDDIAPVAKKIHLVMAEVESVGKDRENKFQNYKYAGEADVVRVIRAAMVKHGLVAVPTLTSKHTIDAGKTKNGADQWLTEITVDYLLIDAETGSFVTATFAGAGIDTGDKGLYKAFTGCNKYALLKTFQIETEDDPEVDSPQRERTVERKQGTYSIYPSKYGTKAKPNFCVFCGKKHIIAGDMIVNNGEDKYGSVDCKNKIETPQEIGLKKGKLIHRIGELETQLLERNMGDDQDISRHRIDYAGTDDLVSAAIEGDKSLTSYGKALSKLLEDSNQ